MILGAVKGEDEARRLVGERVMSDSAKEAVAKSVAAWDERLSVDHRHDSASRHSM